MDSLREIQFSPEDNRWIYLFQKGIPAVFLCNHRNRLEREQLAQAMNLLDERELKRYRRIGPERNKVRFLLSRLLLKRILSLLFGVPDGKITLSGEGGEKPVLNGGRSTGISISYTTGTVGLALGKDYGVGLDIEKIRSAPPAVAERHFSEAERRFIEASADKDEAFFRLWTLKESCAKLTGEGIYKTMQTIEFDLSMADGITQLSRAVGGVEAFFHSGMTADGLMLALASSKPDTPVIYRCEPVFFI